MAVPKTSGRRKPRDAADSVAHSIAHPIRVDILIVLHAGPESAKGLADRLDLPLSNVTHHINELKDAKAIEVAFTKPVGNVLQDFWRATTTSTYYPDDLAKLTREEHHWLSRTIVQSMMAEMLAALRTDRLAGDEFAVTGWDHVWLDRQGHKDMYENTCVFFDRMYDIAAESVSRTEKSGEDPKLYIGGVLSFERARTEPNTSASVAHVGEESPSGREPPFEK